MSVPETKQIEKQKNLATFRTISHLGVQVHTIYDDYMSSHNHAVHTKDAEDQDVFNPATSMVYEMLPNGQEMVWGVPPPSRRYGPIRGTLRYDAISPISFANKMLDAL